MKVIHISNYYASFKGSFIFQLENLANNLKENGDELVFIFPYNAQQTDWINELKTRYKVYFVEHIAFKTQLKVVKQLKCIFEKENPDIIHSHFDGYDIATVKAKKKGVINVFHRHNEFYIRNLVWYKRIYASICIRYKMKYLKKRGYNIFINNEMFNDFIDNNYACLTYSTVIQNGVAISKFNEDSNQHIIKDKPVIFAILGNWERKGGDILFKAIEKINSQKTKVYLASIISSKFIENTIGYCPDWLICLDITDDIKKYYYMSNIFISSSREETFSYALAEAIYCGLPCISSDIRGVQWAKKIESVQFFKNENVDDLVDKIEQIIVNPLDNDTISKGKKYILDNYSEDIWSQNIVDYYKKILKN